VSEAPLTTAGADPVITGEVADAPGSPDSGVVPGPPAGPGDPRVDDAVSRLAEIDALPLAEQVEVYTDIHRRLAGFLADPDSQA
jgi:hypothetical protein